MENKLKVVHISSTDVLGGAAIACLNISSSLSSAGIDSVVLVQKKYKEMSNSTEFSDTFFKKITFFIRFFCDYLSIYLLTVKRRGRFSFPYFGTEITGHPLVKQADIIHLHWINGGFFSLKTFGKLAKLNKPVVWTLHDMWAFTGGCHYSGGCRNYLAGCGNCPALKFPGRKDMSVKIFNGKERSYKRLKLNMVTCSNWLAGEVKSSFLLKDCRVKAIPNPIDTNVFKPMNKSSAAAELSLSPDKTYILFGTMTLKEERKGFLFLREGLRILYRKYPEIRESTEILVFGAVHNEQDFDMHFKTHFLGRIAGTGKLVCCYNAADVFVAPSLEDNLPNTVMESLSCGVPVAAFNIGGMSDMIDHKKNGYLAEPKSAESLADGVFWILNKIKESNELKIESRRKVTDNFTPEIVGKKYLEFYEKILQ